MRIAWGVAVAALGLVIAQVAWDDPKDPGDEARADARRLHCLSARQRPGLVEAAVRLGVAAPGSTATGTGFRPKHGDRVTAATTLDAWNRTSRADFDWACTALAALTGPKTVQDPAPKPTLWRRVAANPTFTLVLGAFLTLGTQRSTERSVRRQALADQLNTAAAEYLKAAHAARLARAADKATDRAGLEGRRVDLGSAILRAGLPTAERRNLDGLLGTAHDVLVGSAFRPRPAEEAVRRLETALGRAVRGESVVEVVAP
ncbi:hypothetical protein GCM10022254_33280 [Actinomadura meridiana]|uniref:Uncharacterized protein n=1 Tax=Actinomadura meridiana TaxID=559626 RepID=A0ABP8C2U0_9ACTN